MEMSSVLRTVYLMGLMRNSFSVIFVTEGPCWVTCIRMSTCAFGGTQTFRP